MTAGKVAAWVESFVLAKRKRGGKGPKTKGTVNLALNYVKRAYVWGMTHRNVSPSAAGAVALVRTIRGDSQSVRRKPRIKAVAWDVVEATCKKLPANVRAMVELQWWTGMRPGEVMRLRPCDIDTSGDVWVYTPSHHKNTWRDKARHVAIGPQGRSVLEHRLPSKTDEWVFRRPRGKRYDRQSYAKSIASAARRAGVEVWAPNRLRHSYATRVRMLHGAQAVQDLLGHATLNQQQVYVDDTLARAKKLAREVG
jgi:integrase